MENLTGGDIHSLVTSLSWVRIESGFGEGLNGVKEVQVNMSCDLLRILHRGKEKWRGEFPKDCDTAAALFNAI